MGLAKRIIIFKYKLLMMYGNCHGDSLYRINLFFKRLEYYCLSLDRAICFLHCCYKDISLSFMLMTTQNRTATKVAFRRHTTIHTISASMCFSFEILEQGEFTKRHSLKLESVGPNSWKKLQNHNFESLVLKQRNISKDPTFMFLKGKENSKVKGRKEKERKSTRDSH